MSLYDVLDQIIALLRQRKRLTYRLVKREFALDDETLADLTLLPTSPRESRFSITYSQPLTTNSMTWMR